MEASSRDALPVVPPRPIPPTIPPRINVPGQNRQRRSPSPRDNRNRRYVDITNRSITTSHERSHSDTLVGTVQAPAELSVFPCPQHDSSPCHIICTNCIEILCDKCIEPEDHKHKNCSLSHIGDNIKSMNDQVRSSLTRKMSATKQCVSNLSRTLTRKKDRMIAKKDETITEIDRFYQRLKAKLLAKLQREENELLTYLQTTVAEQASNLSANIQQCSKLVHDFQQKGTMIDNLDKIHSTSKNTPSYLKSLLSAAADVSKDSRHIDQITAARDAFLVIRFIVNPESEQTIVTTKVASVEVLDSRSSSPNEENIEAEHINEVFSNTGAESSGSVESIETIDNCEVAQTSSASNHQVASGESATNERSSRNQLGGTSNDNSRASSAMSDSARSVDSPRQEIPQSTVENNNTEQTNEESDGSEDPPPPYPGLPSYTRSPSGLLIPEDDPPPYPGPPPPMYVQHPEPQQPRSPHVLLQPTNVPPSSNRQRLGAVSDRQPSPVQLSPTSPRHTPVSMPLPSPVNTPESSFPAVTRPRGPLKSFSINEISDKRSSGIFSLAVYNNNSFLVVDRWNRKLKFFNEQGESFGGVLFREEPWDITKVTNEMFAVTVPKLMTIFKIKASSQTVVTVGNVSTTKKYACIDYHQTSELFVCGQVPQFGEPSIDVIGVAGGPILLTFRSDTLGQDLFSYPRYVKVANDGTVVVCDWNLKSLLVFKLDGTVIGRYKGSQEFLLNEPMGIELDRDTNELYVIDSKQSSSCGTVHKVSLACQCEEVFRGQNDFRDARAVTVFGNQRMAVGSKNGILSIFSTRARYR